MTIDSLTKLNDLKKRYDEIKNLHEFLENMYIHKGVTIESKRSPYLMWFDSKTVTNENLIRALNSSLCAFKNNMLNACWAEMTLIRQELENAKLSDDEQNG